MFYRVQEHYPTAECLAVDSCWTMERMAPHPGTSGKHKLDSVVHEHTQTET